MMKVGFNPAVSFKADETTPKKKGRVDLPEGYAKPDTFEHEQAELKKKHSVKNSIANVWKFFSVTGTMAKAAIKGLFYGITAMTGVVLAFWPFKALPKAFAKDGGETIGKLISNPFKYIGRTGKVVAVGAGLGTLAYHLIAGKLNANQNTAVIDHKMKVKHRQI